MPYPVARKPIGTDPIICGRRNCAVCGRWLHITEFRWRWHPSGYHVKSIGTICKLCVRKKEQKRYYKKSVQERRIIGARANRAKRKRQKELLAQLDEQRVTIGALQSVARIPKGQVDFVPFRMWLLNYLKNNGDPYIDHINSKRLRQWKDGYLWEPGCEPTPIRSISLHTVENVTTRLGHPEAARALYPGRYE